jgi:hypothetical protein
VTAGPGTVTDVIIDMTAFEPRTLEGLGDRELAELLAAALEEQRRRACEIGDPAALIERGFDEGFTAKGEPREPWIEAGVLICPGWIQDKSTLSHTCSFVAIGKTFAWDSDDKIDDKVRHVAGPKRLMRSVTLVAAVEGTEVDQVMSRCTNGVHKMQQVRSYIVRGGELQLVTTRAPKVDRHR